MRCEVAVDIDSRPDYVWAVLTDVARWPTWAPAVREVALPGGGPLGLGSAVRVRAARLPDRTWRVTGFAPRRSFTWTSEGIGSRATLRFRFLPAESGTRLEVELDSSGWIATPVQRVTSATVRRHLDALTGGLKRRCEQRRATGARTG